MVSILLLEKKEAPKSAVVSALSGAGFQVRCAAGVLDALSLFRKERFDLILADHNDDACALVKELRATESDVPFLVLAEKPDRELRCRILLSGADGYIETPPDTEEMILKIRNLLWRCNVETETVLVIGDCRLHSGTMSVEAPERNIELRRMEYLLLEKLLNSPGHIFTRNQLLDDLWGYDCESSPRTVDTHIRRLRKKLKGIDAFRISTIRGIGYQAAIPAGSTFRKAAFEKGTRSALSLSDF